MKDHLNILLLEDEVADAALITRALREGGLSFALRRVEWREEFEQTVNSQWPDVILSDHGLPAFDSVAALAVAREKCPQVPFIVVTGSTTDAITLKALSRGADGAVSKRQLPD